MQCPSFYLKYFYICDKKGAGSNRTFQPKPVFLAQRTNEVRFWRFGPINLLIFNLIEPLYSFNIFCISTVSKIPMVSRTTHGTHCIHVRKYISSNMVVAVGSTGCWFSLEVWWVTSQITLFRWGRGSWRQPSYWLRCQSRCRQSDFLL